MAETRKTTCNRDCPDACGIVATVEDGRVVRLQGDRDHPVTQGFLCYRTSHFLARQYAADRVTRPLLRRGGKGSPLCEVSWDEALDVAAERLLRIRAESGPAAIFHYRSGGSLGHLKLVVDRFWEAFGPVTTKRGDICSGAGDHAQLTDFGRLESNDLTDLENARTILIWGKNVYTSSPHTLPVLKRAKAKGARLILVDSLHTKTASLCDDVVMPRPGGDLALALAVGRLLFERGWLDDEVETYVDHLDGFRALCFDRSVEAWCREADVDVADAERLAEGLGMGRPCTILVGWGMARRVNGSAIVRALDALGAISGNIGVPGAGVSYYFHRKAAFDLSFVEGKSARTLCEPLFGRELLAMQEPPIRAVWITAGNPVAMLPDSEANARAIEQTEFVVVVDSVLTDTAERADLVLPTTTLLEDDDVMGAYGHHWLSVSRPVVPPPEGVKTDLEIIQGLATRVGLDDVVAGSARDWKRRTVEPKLAPHGITLEHLEAGPVRTPLAGDVVFAGRRFDTPSGRVNLMTELPALPGDLPRAEAYPLFLMSNSTPRSQCSQWVEREEGPLDCTVHPDAAAGLRDGQLARLVSEVASLVVRVQLDPRQRRDVAIVPKGGHLKDGRAANLLVRARLTDGGEGAALYDERVRLLPLAEGEGA